MATAFPFNKISKVPMRVLAILLPVITAQQTLAKKLGNRIQEDLENLSKNAKCDDVEVLALKQKLEKLQQIIDNLQRLLGFIPTISNSLRTVNSVAQIISSVQLVIPAAPGVPQAPIMQTLNAAVETIANVTAVLTTLSNVANNVLQIANRIEGVIQQVNDKLKSLCNTPSIPAGSSEIEIDLLDLYPSEFYQLVNVTQEDIDNRLTEIRNLLEEQLDVLTNLNEAPSEIIYGEGAPSASTGQQGDYYVDTETQNVFGPKPTNSSWE